MPNATDQPRNRTMRGTLSILVLAVAIAAGLWYVLERPETPIPPRQTDSTEPESDAAPAAGDSQTADSAPSTDAAQSADSDTASSAGNLQSTDLGTAAPTDAAQTTGSGAAAQGDEPETADSGSAVPTAVAQTTDSGTPAQGEESQTADSGITVPTAVAQTTESGAAAQGEEHGTADSGTTVPTAVAQTTDSGAAAQGEEHGTADSGTTVPTGVAQTTDSGAAAAAGKAQTAEIDTATPTDAIQSTDSGATEATPQIAAVGEADRSGTQALVLSPAPEDTIEQVPVDAPPATDTAGETGILATVDRVIERIETAIREQLATEPEGDPDTQLRVQVTYDDSQGDATQPGGEPSEPARPTDSDTNTLSDAGQTTDSAATLPAGDAPTADSGVTAPADIAQSADSGTPAQGEESQTADSGTTVPTAVAQTTDSGAAAQGEEHGTADSGTPVPTAVAQTTDSGAAAQEEEHGTADSGTTVPTGVAQTTDSGAAAVAGKAQTAEIDTATPTEAIQSTDSGATEATPQIAAVGEADRSGTQALVLSPAPEDTIEQVPVDAPPATDAAGETGILATVDRVIERIETAIRERLATEPEGDPDTQLRVQVTYDDSQGDATQPGGEPSEPARPTDSGTNTLSDAGQTTDSAATLPAGDAPTADSGVMTPADIAQSADSGVIAPADIAQSADSGVIAPADVAQSAGSGVIALADIAQSADSGVIAPADITQSADSDDTPPPEVTRTADSDAADAEAEAKEYVEALTETAPQTIPVDKADYFVTQEHVLSLVPEDTIERISVDELAKDESLKAETPITIVREVEQIETAVPERLIAESGGDLDTKLRVLVKYDDTEGVTEPSVTEPSVTEPSVTEPSVTEPSVTEPSVADQGDAEPSVAAQGDVEPGNVGQTVAQQDTVEQITVREALKRILAEPEKPISLIKTVRYFEVVTLRELLDTEVDTDTFLNVVRRPYRIEVATLADLLQRKKAENPDTIFYLHTVQPTDEQGIWGIVQFGIIDNFAHGVALKRGEKMETYTVQIPRHADEQLDDQSSSFLGKLIDRKTKDSYVYNYRDNRMGRNPDRIYPGQEIVIINFEPEELTAVYTHFASG